MKDLSSIENSDIIYKKHLLGALLKSDTDIREALELRDPLPLSGEETTAERARIQRYNAEQNEKILPYLKLSKVREREDSYILYEIEDKNLYQKNKKCKRQEITLMCVVHENKLNTPYGITRTDLLSYLIKNRLNFSHALGSLIYCTKDTVDIIDAKYYARILTFETQTIHINPTGGKSPYDQTVPY